MGKALAAYERSDALSTFDSKYDRFLRGEEKLTDQEELGRVLMSSTQFTNCNTCHTIKGEHGLSDGVFTNHKYFNIGVPANKLARAPMAPSRMPSISVWRKTRRSATIRRNAASSRCRHCAISQ